jgi:adenylylsulfate kinase
MTQEQVLVTWHTQAVVRPRGCVVWFTGLSGCGKSTVANLVDRKLFELGAASFVLDGDNVRHSLNASPQMLAPEHGEEFAARFGLGFSASDREENIRRIAAVAELFASAGLVALTAFVSPYRRDRQLARRLVEERGSPGDFIEVFVDAPIEVCEGRDPKGLYKMARAGKLPGFTGIDDPYEAPQAPELTLAAAVRRPDELADEVVGYLESKGKIARKS